MAVKAMRPCAQPGCCALTSGTYCDRHRRPDRGRRDVQWRGWYTSKRYRTARDAFMAEHPLCAQCGAPSSDLDHKKPHKGDLGCGKCHSAKTAAEDGGFGNAQRR